MGGGGGKLGGAGEHCRRSQEADSGSGVLRRHAGGHTHKARCKSNQPCTTQVEFHFPLMFETQNSDSAAFMSQKENPVILKWQ